MEQLILHLICDQILISNKMAANKTKNAFVAVMHSLIYTLFFAIFFSLINHVLSPLQIVLILLGHFLIDYFYVVRYVIYAKNWLSNHELPWAHCKTTGNPHSVPQHIAALHLLVIDLSLHLLVNFLIIRLL